MNDRKNNLSDKNIREFTTDDTIFISRMERGYQIMYYCKFNRFVKGMVMGNIIDAEPDWAMHSTLLNKEISARLNKCYLFGKREDDYHNICFWFKKDGFAH